MKKFFQEFREFALRGSVMDLAVGVIMGAAFQAVVTSLTTNILSPLIGILLGGIDLSHLSVTVRDVPIQYGAFITAIISFLITAFVVFLLVKGMNKLAAKNKKEMAPVTKSCPFCCTDIPLNAVRCPHCTAEIPKT